MGAIYIDMYTNCIEYQDLYQQFSLKSKFKKNKFHENREQDGFEWYSVQDSTFLCTILYCLRNGVFF